jgi:peroxiredoxin
MEPAVVEPPTRGSKVADFILPDCNGHPWQLSAHAAQGMCLLVFYRGHW